MKKRVLTTLIATIFISTSFSFSFQNSYGQDINLKAKTTIDYYDTKKGDITLSSNFAEIREKGIKSFDYNNGKLYLLDTVSNRIIIYKNDVFINSLSLSIDTPLDIKVKNDNIFIVDSKHNIFELDMQGKVQKTIPSSEAGTGDTFFSVKKDGQLMLGNYNVDTGKTEADPFGFKLVPSSKDMKKFVDLESTDGKVSISIPFQWQNGGAWILGQDKQGNLLVKVRDVKIGTKIDALSNIVYKIGPDGSISDKLYVPTLAQYITPFKSITEDENGGMYYLYDSSEGVNVYQISRDSNSLLSSVKDFVLGAFNVNVSAMSRREAQDRAFQMADFKWHYISSRNGKVMSYTALNSQLVGKTDSIETGIPYCWGGYDGLDTRSSSSWSNFNDAIENHGAQAGNIGYSGSYKGGTAGLDCSGFVSSVWRLNYKRSTYGLADFTTPVRYDQLTYMDILDWPEDHVVFFKSWLYDQNGGMLGANTIEETGGNNDGTGEKVKSYFRTLDELYENYEAGRYINIGNDYVESNSSQPVITTPLFMQNIDKKNTVMNINWIFTDQSSAGKQTAYKIKVYQGDIGNTSQYLGYLIYSYDGTGSAQNIGIDIKNYANGSYFFTLETKNSEGYWCAPVCSPFTIVDDASSIPKDTTFSSIQRFAGADRYETSRLVADQFGSSFDNVVIATGSDFPDALSGAVLAKKFNAPIILVNKSASENSSTLEYINSKIKSSGAVYILGGTGVIDSSYEAYFKSKGINYKRVSGNDRIGTSLQIAQNVGANSNSSVFISTAFNFPDALSCSSAAGMLGAPILLTESSDLSSSVQNYLASVKPKKVYIIGGTGAVSDSVKGKIKTILGYDDNSVIRLSGATRYETSNAISENFFKSPASMYLSTGKNFPDALCASALAAKKGSPIMLMSNDNYTQALKYVNDVNGNNISLSLLGGETIVDSYTVSKIQYYAK